MFHFLIHSEEGIKHGRACSYTGGKQQGGVTCVKQGYSPQPRVTSFRNDGTFFYLLRNDLYFLSVYGRIL